MPPNLALFICISFIVIVFLVERKRDVHVSWALIVPLLWYLVAASRPLGVWLWIVGVRFSGSYDPIEGNFVDRWFYSILLVIGLIILARRRCNWHSVLKENAWFLALYGFMAFSILWSDYPMVSFKRLIKSFGAVIMALVVLTETKPLESIAAILRRCAYITIPLSIVLIRYYRDIGVLFDWFGGSVSWVGVALSKNTLGQLAVTGALYFIWERVQKRGYKQGKMIDFLYLLMCLYLLKGSDDAVSMTSLSVFLVGLVIFLMLQYLRSSRRAVNVFSQLSCTFIFFILIILIWHTLVPFSENSYFGTIIIAMGRDLTLTGRTEIWSDVFAIASKSSAIGVGYGAFWISRLANIPWTENLSWTLGQAHNGYVDAYLQLGWLGVSLLIVVIFASIRKNTQYFPNDFEFGRIRMTFVLMILFVNIMESTFLRGEHSLWFLFLLSALYVPYKNTVLQVRLAKTS